MNYELHPLCTLFPRMADAEFAALVADIKANGLREPITTHGGMILDGGNRYRACIDAGLEPTFSEFKGGNIVAYVLSANLHRRHMTAGQQAAIVASAQDWGKAHVHGGDRKSYQGKALDLDTVKGRQAQSGASKPTQIMADMVAKASPELAKQVAHGEISLPKAAEQISGKRSVAKAPEPLETPAIPDGMIQIEQDRLDELRANLQEALDDNNSMARVFEANDKLVAALEEAKRYREQNRILESRIAGLMNEKNEAIRAAKSWQNKFLKLEKQAGLVCSTI